VQRWIAPLVLCLAARPASAQTVAPVPRYRAGWWDVASVAVAGTAYLLPSALGLPKNGPSCVPCNPASLPGIDRWVVGPVSNSADIGSDVVLAGVAGLTAFVGLTGQTSDQLRGNFAMFANTASWTAAATEWVKVTVHRERPVLYTTGAAAAAADKDNEQSMPSMHAALAFAAATSYFVMSLREHLPHRKRNAALLYAGAVGVGVLRVAAAKHFPTDVLAGAALGSAMGWLGPTVHPIVH